MPAVETYSADHPALSSFIRWDSEFILDGSEEVFLTLNPSDNRACDNTEMMVVTLIDGRVWGTAPNDSEYPERAILNWNGSLFHNLSAPYRTVTEEGERSMLWSHQTNLILSASRLIWFLSQ